MDAISSLNALGLTLPGPAYLFGSVVFGLIGLAAFRYGRRHDQRISLWLGVLLMLFPYAIEQTWLLYLVGCTLCAGLWWDRRGHS